MATMRLVPSTLNNAAGSSYLEITNSSNALTNTDSTAYATVYNKNKSSSSRYIYLQGFNFSDIPANATVNGFSIKLKANESGGSSSSSYRPRICNGTSTLTADSSVIGSSVSVITFTNVSPSWDTIKGYGSNFGIRIDCKRNNKNTAAYYYIYGAEIEVTYTLPSSETIYFKSGSSWMAASKVYKKVSGSWVKQTNLSNVFQAGVNYKKG